MEELPNELFFLIFSYLKSDMVIQTFINLNRRFQSLILQYTHYLVLSPDTRSSSVNKYISFIQNEIETIRLNIDLIPSIFTGKYSYPNLRSITMSSSIDWQVELNTENISPIVAIVSALNVFRKCSIGFVKQDFFKLFDCHQIDQSGVNEADVVVLPCSAIRRLWIFECDENNLWKLCELTPELIYLKVWLRPSSTSNYSRTVPSTKISLLGHLDELYIKVIDLQSFNNVRLLIGHCQTSLRRIILNLGEDLMVDGKALESLLSPLTSLEMISFISQLSKRNITDLLRSFQSKWWLDIRRPPVIIHETKFDQILMVSIPSSFSNIFKDRQFSTDLRSWHLNKGKFDSSLPDCLKARRICFSSKQSISLEFLKLATRIFYSRKQILECNYWGLIFEQEYFLQYMNQSIAESILPNITRLKITHVNGLTPLTLAVWLLLAPNVRIFEIEYLSFNETLEWITDLHGSLQTHGQRLKMIFQRISKIIISSLCYNCDEKFREKICTILSQIFPMAFIQ